MPCASLLFRQFLAQRAQPGLDDGSLIEVAVARFRRELELAYCTFEIALPRVELALMTVLLLLLAEFRVRLRGNPVQGTVACEAHEFAFEVSRGLLPAACLDQRLRIVVDELHLVRVAGERGLESRNGKIELP